jgi:hypothetical protein
MQSVANLQSPKQISKKRGEEKFIIAPFLQKEIVGQVLTLYLPTTGPCFYV